LYYNRNSKLSIFFFWLLNPIFFSIQLYAITTIYSICVIGATKDICATNIPGRAEANSFQTTSQYSLFWPLSHKWWDLPTRRYSGLPTENELPSWRKCKLLKQNSSFIHFHRFVGIHIAVYNFSRPIAMERCSSHAKNAI
jgi:hypothetical protein